MNINEFINSLNRVHSIKNWTEILVGQGYYPVSANFGSWGEMHEWCLQQLGEQHYTWTGNIFWFETEQAAVLFALRWS